MNGSSASASRVRAGCGAWARAGTAAANAEAAATRASRHPAGARLRAGRLGQFPSLTTPVRSARRRGRGPRQSGSYRYRLVAVAVDIGRVEPGLPAVGGDPLADAILVIGHIVGVLRVLELVDVDALPLA